MTAKHGGQKNRNGKTTVVLYLPCFLLVVVRCFCWVLVSLYVAIVIKNVICGDSMVWVASMRCDMMCLGVCCVWGGG